MPDNVLAALSLASFWSFGVAFVNGEKSDRMDDVAGSGVFSGCRRTPYTIDFVERFPSYALQKMSSRRFHFGG